MTRDEIICEKFDLYGALYMLCSRWHSGQWSRGYRILGRLINKGYKPGLTQCNSFESDAQRDYYRRYYKLRDKL